MSDTADVRLNWFGQPLIEDRPSKVVGYGVGDEIPAGAVYVSTKLLLGANRRRKVWHYFRVPI